jgi:hypothetical protein
MQNWLCIICRRQSSIYNGGGNVVKIYSKHGLDKVDSYVFPSKLIRHKDIRLKIMNHLGGAVCLDCGLTDYEKLQFHHIYKEHTKEDRIRFNNTLGRNTYYSKHLDEARWKLQVLCRCCNCARERKY